MGCERVYQVDGWWSVNDLILSSVHALFKMQQIDIALWRNCPYAPSEVSN